MLKVSPPEGRRQLWIASAGANLQHTSPAHPAAIAGDALSHLFVYLSDAQPTEEECQVWNQVDLVLQDSESILMGLREYKGASQEIRDVRTLEAPCENSNCLRHAAEMICG